MEQENPKKRNYRSVFWNLFGVGVLISLVANALPSFNLSNGISLLVNLFLFIALIIIFVLWVKYFNEAWKAVGKKYGWAVGLLALIPFGVFVAIGLASKYLKGTEYWGKKEYESFKLQ
ncbi:MAG TPA: hypothetical protein DEA43_04795 [Candidatus Moranbacteria bacterium]|nr:hypothetical protein [Candidatus Moranbacteria bacterium]HBT46172.1 hypothetical protein [Candidatus Moranbacteria bacterium]